MKYFKMKNTQIFLLRIFSGWIGGFISKITFKPKNQMILPDDKDPTVSRRENIEKTED